jgi:hypothetical protein
MGGQVNGSGINVSVSISACPECRGILSHGNGEDHQLAQIAPARGAIATSPTKERSLPMCNFQNPRFRGIQSLCHVLIGHFELVLRVGFPSRGLTADLQLTLARRIAPHSEERAISLSLKVHKRPADSHLPSRGLSQ